MKYIISILGVCLIGFIGLAWYQGWFEIQWSVEEEETAEDTTVNDEEAAEQNQQEDEERDEETEDEESREKIETIGRSAGDREIRAYRFGEGAKELLLVGGIHGGYSANTVLLGHELINWLETEPASIPNDLTVTVIPVLNPDGVAEVFGSQMDFTVADIPAATERVSGRFNQNEVDLNRNFDCQWQSSAVWRAQEVDAGSQAFSEAESQALRDYVDQNNIAAAVVFYSEAGEVMASSCNGDPSTDGLNLAEVYAEASGYTLQDSFDHYELSGDAADWLDKVGVPVISVILDDHYSVEENRNRAGLRGLLEWFE